MYAIGHYGYTSIGVKLVALYHMEDTVAYAGQVFTEHAFAALVLAAFTLLPDRFFALAAGVFSVSLPVFFLGIFTGRVLRAGIFAYLLSRYGERIKDYMFQRLDKVLAFFALVILAILYIAFR
jgi:membrane protein YqaA with SNARE-associated domain